MKELIQCFDGEAKQALEKFRDDVIETRVIPYKIRNKAFEVEILTTTAFSLYIIFCNVLIEDGRHPREILMKDVSGEAVDGHFRIRFINALMGEEGAKESSFVFDKIERRICFWNYNFYTLPVSKGTDKLPWRLLVEPMQALVHKAAYLGTAVLNDDERRILPVIRPLLGIVMIYLREDTRIAFGRIHVRLDPDCLNDLQTDDVDIYAMFSLFEEIEWNDLSSSRQTYTVDKLDFLRWFIASITGVKGQWLYRWLLERLEQAARPYPRLKALLPAYAGHHQQVIHTMDTLFEKRHWQGSYPHYHRAQKPGFIEVSRVYERKYTHLNEKKKIILYQIIESVVDGNMRLTALWGMVYSQDRGDLYDEAMTAADTFFANDGRRVCEVMQVLDISPDMEEAQVFEAVKGFVYNFLKMR